MLKRDSLVRGAFILAFGSLFSRTLGALYRFALPALLGGGEVGTYGVGLFGFAYQIYAVVLTVSTVGLPLAVSKMISQRLAEDDPHGAARVFGTARWLLGGVGLFSTVLLILVAPLFARIEPNALYSIYAIAPAVFFVSVMAPYRGLFQGLQFMTPYAMSQVYEQLIRIATIMLGAVLLLPYGVPIAAAGASFGAVTGAVVGLLYLLWVMRRHRAALASLFAAAARPLRRESTRTLIRELLHLAIPISLAGLAFPLFGLMDLLFVPLRLQALGFTSEQATTAYGALTQLANPFINVPLTFTTGFALALVPAIAEAWAAADRKRVQRGTGTALRMAMIIAMPCVVGLVVLATPLVSALYDYPPAGGPLQVLAVAALFIGLQQMSSAVYQGMGLPMLPVRNLMIGLVVKAGLTWLLTGIPGWGVEGAALATVIGFATSGLLNVFGLRRQIGGLGLTPGEVLRPALAAVIMGVVVAVLFSPLAAVTEAWLGGRTGLLAATLTVVAAGAVAYGIALLAVGGVREGDLQQLGRLQGPLRLLKRWRLLRP